jgi:hypothetical protein
MDDKSAVHKRGRPVFSHDEPVDRFHNDGESFILCLRCDEGRHDMLQCSYDVMRVTASPPVLFFLVFGSIDFQTWSSGG